MRISTQRLALPQLLLVRCLLHSHAFVSTSSNSCRKGVCSFRLKFSAENDDQQEEDLPLEQEFERQRLETLLGNDMDVDVSDPALIQLPYDQWKKRLPETPPPLTSIGRQRLELEITLLQSLEDSDAALGQLWNLWYTTRGIGQAKKLILIEAQEESEEDLRELIAQQGLYWSQPVKRLATVCFLQKRFEEARVLNEVVVAAKPWDFSALKGIVLACEAMGDEAGIAQWSKKRLPNLGPGRVEWVKLMVGLAQKRLAKGESDIEESFQGCDAGENVTKPVVVETKGDDVWQ